MDKRKALVSGAVIAGIIVIVACLWFVKRGTATAGNAPAEKAPVTSANSPLLDEPLNLTEPFDLDLYRSAGVPVIIDFGADSCVPCKEMAPVLVELHEELRGKAIIRFVDVWKYRDLADGYPLQVIPTQVFFDAEGKPFAPAETLQLPLNHYTTRDTNEHVFTTHEGGISKDQLITILTAMGMKK